MGLPLRYHWFPVALLEARVTLPPAQKVVGPPGGVAWWLLLGAPPRGLPLGYPWLPGAGLEGGLPLPPARRVSGPPGVMVGVAGIGLTVTLVGAEGALLQPLAVTVTV